MKEVYFYVISCGEWSDYQRAILYSGEKYSNKEFVNMYNKAVVALGGKVKEYNIDAIAEKMADLFNFLIVEEEVEINACYEEHYPINLDKVDEKFSNISVSDMRWGD